MREILMPETGPFRTRYVFIDVVRFSTRTVEARTDIVTAINSIVRAAINAANVLGDDVIFLPTGDGLCIALVSAILPYDGHLRIALDIIARVAEHNRDVLNKSRAFEVRVGLNENDDN